MDVLYGEIEQLYITTYGVSSYRQAKYAISCVCANLVYAVRHSNKIFVSRDKTTYKPLIINGSRQQLNLGYSAMINILNMLEDYGIIKATKGHKYYDQPEDSDELTDEKVVLHKSLGYIELTEFGEELIMSKVDILNITNKPRSSLLVLMDTKKEPMCYEETEEAKVMMALVDKYNKFMAKQSVESAEGDLLHTSLSRVFSRGELADKDSKFVFGGRFYGEGTNYQQLPQIERKRIRINDEPVYELDFKCIHISIHCSKEGITLPEGFDVYSQYDVANYTLDPEMTALATAWYKHDYNPYREFEKLAWLILINCGKRDKTRKQNRRLAIQTLEQKLKEDAKEPLHLRKFVGIKAVDIEGVINHIENSSGVGQDLLYSDKGVELMRDDSDIMQIILTNCVDNGIPVLCVHDSVIVPQSKVGKVMEIMKSAYAEVCGTEDNCVITIK
jgi:hypothetical protein